MIQGRVDVSGVTAAMLAAIKFTEKNYVASANGIWAEFGVDTPNYPKEAAVVYQCFGTDCPDWVEDIRRMFDGFMLHSTVTVNKLTPGCFIPPHKDHFYKLQEATASVNKDDLTMLRINVLLQDKKLGHILDIDGRTLDQYSAGDYVYILPGIVHTAANLGCEDRYTLQVSGLVRKDLLNANLRANI